MKSSLVRFLAGMLVALTLGYISHMEQLEMESTTRGVFRVVGLIVAVLAFGQLLYSTGRRKNVQSACDTDGSLDSREIAATDVNAMAQELRLNPSHIRRALVNSSSEAESGVRAEINAIRSKQDLLRYSHNINPGSANERAYLQVLARKHYLKGA